MNTEPFLVNVLLNNTVMVQALLDNSCLYSGGIDNALVDKLGLPRAAILPRQLKTAENSSTNKPIVSPITSVHLDLDGVVTPKLWLYVIPHSSHMLILGKRWLEDHDAIIHSKEQRLEIRKFEPSIPSVSRWRNDLSSVPRPRYTHLNGMAMISKTVPVCKATIDDFSKALSKNSNLSLDEARKRLPSHLKDFARLFSDSNGAGNLPQSKGNLVHAINLREEGKLILPPWGPLYHMSREKLLVLRKNLTDLFEKGWIRPSNSPAAAPVLFAKKPNGGLRFCVDYRGLSSIMIPDRYPLPFFKEILPQLSKVRWLTKLDVKSAFHLVRIREEDEWKTAFCCRLGLFEWLVTPFGLVNTPATFQCYINEKLRENLD